MSPTRTAQTLFHVLNPTPLKPGSKSKAKFNPSVAASILDYLLDDLIRPDVTGMGEVLEYDRVLTELGKELGVSAVSTPHLYRLILQEYKNLYLEYSPTYL